MNAKQRLKNVKFFTAQLRNYDDAVRRIYKEHEEHQWTTLGKSRADEILHGLERWRNVMAAAVSKLESNTTVEGAYSTIQQESAILLTLIDRYRRIYPLIDTDLAVSSIVTDVRNWVRQIEKKEEEEEQRRQEEEEREEEEREEEEEKPRIIKKKEKVSKLAIIFDRHLDPEAQKTMLQSLLVYLDSADIESTRQWLMDSNMQEAFGFSGISFPDVANDSISVLLDRIAPTNTATRYWTLVRSSFADVFHTDVNNLHTIMDKINTGYTPRSLISAITKIETVHTDALRMLEFLYLGGVDAPRHISIRQWLVQTASDVLLAIGDLVIPPIVDIQQLQSTRYYLFLLLQIQYRRKDPNLSVINQLFNLANKIVSPDFWPITPDSNPHLDLAWLPQDFSLEDVSLIQRDNILHTQRVIRNSWHAIDPTNGLNDTMHPKFINFEGTFKIHPRIELTVDMKKTNAKTVGDYLSKLWFDGLTAKGEATVDFYIDRLSKQMYELVVWIRSFTDWPMLRGPMQYTMESLLTNEKLIYQRSAGIPERNRMGRFLLFSLTNGMWISRNATRALYTGGEIHGADKINDVLSRLSDTTISITEVFGNAFEDIGSFNVIHPLFIWWSLARRIALLNKEYLDDFDGREPAMHADNYVATLITRATLLYEGEIDVIAWSDQQDTQLWEMAATYLHQELVAIVNLEASLRRESAIREFVENEQRERGWIHDNSNVQQRTFAQNLSALKILFKPQFEDDTRTIPVIRQWLFFEPSPTNQEIEVLMPFFTTYARNHVRDIERLIEHMNEFPAEIINQDVEAVVLLVAGLLENRTFPQAMRDTVVTQFIKGTLASYRPDGRSVTTLTAGERTIPRWFKLFNVVIDPIRPEHLREMFTSRRCPF